MAGKGIEWGLIGPKEGERIWERHIENCLPITTLIPEGKVHLADVGSGAGLPGIVIALLRPNAEISLIEPIPRRAQFLKDTCVELGIKANVIKAKSESVKSKFEIITARAVAPLPKLIASTWHLLGPNGRILAIKGESAINEIAETKAPNGGKIELHEINFKDLPLARVIEVSRAG